MFDKLFGKQDILMEPTEPYVYHGGLVLDWSVDSEGWVAPLLQLDEEAQIYIGPKNGFDPPKDSSCDVVIKVLSNIDELVQQAKHYIVRELNKSELYRDNNVSENDFKPTGIEIFEFETTPGEYSLTFDPNFDPGSIYRVYFKDGVPFGWGFDD